MTRIKCICGKCELHLNDRKIYYSLFCGCEDCRQAAKWGERKGGKSPEKLQKLIYMRSDISKVKGKKFMKAYQLRKDARSTRVYCISCYSILGIDHPSYDNNVFMLIPFLCNADFDTTIKPIAGIFMDDYPHKMPKKLLNNILIYNNFKNKEKEKKLDSILAKLKPIYKNAKGKSLQNLIKDLGKIEILNLKKGSD